MANRLAGAQAAACLRIEPTQLKWVIALGTGSRRLTEGAGVGSIFGDAKPR